MSGVYIIDLISDWKIVADSFIPVPRHVKLSSRAVEANAPALEVGEEKFDHVVVGQREAHPL